MKKPGKQKCSIENLTEELNDNVDILVDYFQLVLERLDKIIEILKERPTQ